MTALLRFERVALMRGGRLLFEDLDLALAPGEALLVRGPNGSGKSSLIRLAAGLLDPAAGRVERCAVALADEHHALDRELPLGRALAFWGGDSLDELGIAHLRDVPVRLLSSGQRNRAALARVAGSNARLWLLDEPLNALDGDGGERLQAVIARHLAAGGAVLAASHQPIAGIERTLELGA